MPSDRAVRLWPVTVLLLLLPLWCAGLFGRWYWTPDEPREAAQAWSMVHQVDKTVPQLAGTTFCEKPPLAYWASAASMAVLGKHPAAARLPNLLWAIAVVLAVGLAAHAMAGPAAAVAAAVVMGSMALSFQVAIWIASDAPLLAGVCLALTGIWRGLLATTSRQRFGWFTLMHVGLVLGFMSKNIIAWVVPCLALAAFVAWERRWAVLLRWEFYIGALLQVAIIAPWLLAVASGPEGHHHLKVFFWDNLVGRFLPVASEGNYCEGHGNFPGKYLLELPAFTVPWLFLAAAAARRAWQGVRTESLDRSAWRWCACVVIPATLLLSLSTTARGIYYGIVLPGFALAIGLWAARHLVDPDRFERVCLWLTAGMVALVGVVIGPATLVMIHRFGGDTAWPTVTAIMVGGLAAGALSWKLLWQVREKHHPAAMFTLMLILSVSMLVAWRGVFPIIDRWQHLGPMTSRVAALVEAQAPGRAQVVLWQPDETTVAMLDYFAGLRLPEVQDEQHLQKLRAADPKLTVVLRIKDREVDEVLAQGFVVEETIDIPHGRSYAILRPDDVL